MYNVNEFNGMPLFPALNDFNVFRQSPDQREILNFFKKLNFPDNQIFDDYLRTLRFLEIFTGQPNTFYRYRSETQRYLNFIWVLRHETLEETDQVTLKAYFEFLKHPPKSWIARGIHASFVEASGIRWANPDWRPFSLRSSELNYSVSQSSLNSSHRALYRYYQWLFSNEHVARNPLDKPFEPNKRRAKPKMPSELSAWGDTPLHDAQWDYFLQSLMDIAESDPRYERHLFIVVTMKCLMLKLGDLAGHPGQNGCVRPPSFGDFYCKWPDEGTGWIFNTGGIDTIRSITVPEDYLPFLTRWRLHLGLAPTFDPIDETSLLLPSRRSGGLSARQIQRIVTQAIDIVIELSEDYGYGEKAAFLRGLRGHTEFLHHTGAMQALKNSYTLSRLSYELGHSSLAYTASIYVTEEHW